MIPVRVLLFTFLVSLLAFAVSLLVGLGGVVLISRWRGLVPDFRFAYRYLALPFAIAVGAIVLVLSSTMEVRHYRQSKVLAELEKAD